MRSFAPRSAGRWLAVLTLTAAGTAAAVGYALTAPKQYRATAQLLVSPVAVNDPNFTGLDVLRDTGGKRTAAATAAALLRSPQVADVVRADLGLARSQDSLVKALDSHVIDSSDVVAVTVEDTSAAGAAQLANAFADALVKQRTAGFQSQLAATIRRVRQQLDALSPPARSAGVGLELQKRLSVLGGFQGQPDPTLRHAGQASAPTSADWPSLPRLAGIGAAAGLAAGLLAALLLALDRVGGRRVGGAAAPYGRGVSDRLVDRLEERLTARIAALELERERLSAREAAFAAREKEIAAKLDELRDAAATAAREQADGAPVEAAAAAFAARESALQARVAELTKREIALARRAADVASREQAAEGRSEELAVRAAELEAQVEEVVRAAIQVPERPPEPDREAQPVRLVAATPEPPAAAPPVAAGGPNGAWNLIALERLVSDRGDEFPDRREEWSSYLYFLREYAAPDGTVPASFDWLIEDTFSELVA